MDVFRQPQRTSYLPYAWYIGGTSYDVALGLHQGRSVSVLSDRDGTLVVGVRYEGSDRPKNTLKLRRDFLSSGLAATLICERQRLCLAWVSLGPTTERQRSG